MLCRISSSCILGNEIHRWLAHLWCLIKIIQCFPRIKPTLYSQFKAKKKKKFTHTPLRCESTTSIISIYQSDKLTKQATHKHIQLPEPWVIHLWIRIQRLYITVLFTLWLFQFKTSWFMTLIVFVLCIWLEQVFSFMNDCVDVCMQELSLLPVYDCTHVQADILKSSHSSFFHCMQISRLIIHQDCLHTALERTPGGRE